MKYILVLVSSQAEKPLLEKHLSSAAQVFDIPHPSWSWLAVGKAAELYLGEKPDVPARKRLEEMLTADRIDFFSITDSPARKKKLLLSDMDNTMVRGETLDELADACGLKEEIAVITGQAMRGEIDFPQALRTRVARLKGLSTDALQKTADGIVPMPGAEILVRTMRKAGARCVLVSGGFSCFTEPVAKRLGFHGNHGNILEIRDNRLTGKVGDPIVDHESKLAYLNHYTNLYEIDIAETMAIGDGANDLQMICAAGLGVGYHPKTYLKERIDNSIIHGDLSALLFVQGYTDFL